jgi:iron complex outermembrane receptor protein
MSFARLLLGSAALVCALPANARPEAAPEEAASPGAPAPEAAEPGQSGGTDADHQEIGANIVVTGSLGRSKQDLLGGTTVLSGDALTRSLRPTLGETLARQPGVTSSSFGPGASRPILRGLQGDRARVLTEGIGSFDVSTTSVDHAVAINPLIADRIEVLRGPAALMFGPSAIGGVVNVIDSRIPRHLPEEPVHIDGTAGYGSAADERTAAGTIDVPVGGKVVFHADGSYTKSDDLETGGHILAGPQRRAAAASGDPEIAELANLKGRLPNSSVESWQVAGGAAVVAEGGNLGFSVSHYDTNYGVPIRYAIEAGEEAEAVRIDMRQTRLDMRGEVETGGFIERLRFRGAIADYQHQEIENTGEVGTTFYSQGLEARVEAQQADRDGWRGTSGAQMLIRTLNVVGEEKFLPRNETQQYSVFTLQSADFGAIRGELSGRYERTNAVAQPDADLGNGRLERSFNAFSAAGGASVALGGSGVRFGVSLSHSERAPTAEELFANGPHAGTQAFEIGDADLGVERSNGVEATLKGGGDAFNFSLAAYHNWYDGFIYERPTGELEDGLPVFNYEQVDARFYGVEAEASARLAQFGSTAVVVDGVADYTHATIKNGGPVPRIPPLRLLGGIEAQGALAQGRLEVEHVTKQDRVAVNETETGAYTLVNASLTLKPWGRDNPTSLLLSANNLFDVVARRHASYLKDYAPLAGRDLRVTARFAL